VDESLNLCTYCT